MFKKVGSNGVALVFSDKLKEEFFGDSIESIREISEMAEELEMDFEEAEELLNLTVVSFLCSSSSEFRDLFYFFCVIYNMQELDFLSETYVEIPSGSELYFPSNLKSAKVGPLTDRDLNLIFDKCPEWDYATADKLKQFFKAFSESNYFDAKQ